jgi:putative phosphoserine phosphatase/1-acylglycerol-3-phosphate O-acyltransferase
VTGRASYIAAFDLDKTILSVNSSRIVVQKSREMGFMNSREFRQAIYYSVVYKFDLKDANEIVLSMMQWLKGLKEEEVNKLAREQVVPYLLQVIRPEIRDEIAMHRKNNGMVVLLSSALPYLCQPVSDHLQMDDVVCSLLDVSQGHFTGKARRKLVFGMEKAVRMKEYCESRGYPLETAWYYGDAYTDRFVMQSVGNPVAVKPEIKLWWMAKRRGWKII